MIVFFAFFKFKLRNKVDIFEECYKQIPLEVFTVYFTVYIYCIFTVCKVEIIFCLHKNGGFFSHINRNFQFIKS